MSAANPVSVPATLNSFSETWSQRLIASVDSAYDVKVAKIDGPFIWHSHPDADELFYLLKGNLTLEVEDAVESVTITDENDVNLFVSDSTKTLILNVNDAVKNLNLDLRAKVPDGLESVRINAKPEANVNVSVPDRVRVSTGSGGDEEPRDVRKVEMKVGDVFVVQRGVRHKPVAEQAEILLLEKKGVVNTGDAGDSERTRGIKDAREAL